MGRAGHPGSSLEAFWDLERFLSRTHLGLSGLERESERRGRELLRRSLQAHLDARGDGDVGPALVVEGPEGPLRLSHKRLHTRRLLTIFGEVSVTRMGYGARGQPSLHPFDAELCLPARIYSYEICRRITRAVVCGPFSEAMTLVADMTGVRVPMRSAEAIVKEAAADFEDFYQRHPREATRPGPGELLIGAIDCKGIPLVKPDGAEKVVRRKKGEKANKKKMATVAAVYSQRPCVRTSAEVLDSLFRSPDAPPCLQRRWPSASGPVSPRTRTPSSPTCEPRCNAVTPATGAPG